MTGKTYEKVMAQLGKQGMLHPDAHLLFNLSDDEQPSVVSAIMTQISLNFGLNKWKEKGRKAMKSYIKQFHFCDTFEPRHRHELPDKENPKLLSHIFSQTIEIRQD